MVKQTQEQAKQHLEDAEYHRHFLFVGVGEGYFVNRHLPYLKRNDKLEILYFPYAIKFGEKYFRVYIVYDPPGVKWNHISWQLRCKDCYLKLL